MLLNAAKTRCLFCCLWLLRGRRGCGRHWLLCRRILLCRRGRRAVSFGTGASLATRAAGFGLPPNRGPKASRGFTLVGTAGRAAKRLLGSCRLLFCVASGFLTAPRGDGYSLAGAASPVKVVLALTVAEGVRDVHNSYVLCLSIFLFFCGVPQFLLHNDRGKGATDKLRKLFL